MPAWLDVSRRPFGAALVLGLAHALLLGVAFPPLNWWWCGLLAAAPVMVVALRTARPWRSGLAVAVGSVPMWAAHHAWTWEVSSAGMPGLVAYLAVWSGLFVVVAHAALRVVPRESRWMALAVVWIGLEHLRGSVVGDGYPWFLLGHPMIEVGPIAAWGAVIGAMGVGFIVALVNGAAACACITKGRTRTRQAALGMVVLGLTAIIGAMELSAPQTTGERRLRVGVVQTSMPQSNKQFASIEERFAAFQQWMRLTRDMVMAEPKPDLVIWPETMFPGLALDEPALSIEREAGLTYELRGETGVTRMPSTIFADTLRQAARDWGTPMLIGAIGWDGLTIETRPTIETNGARFNSVVALDGMGDGVTTSRYDKVALTPFGEVMPYISAWPWLERKLLNLGAQGMRFDLREGPGALPLTIPGPASELVVGTPICFESTVSWVCRGMAYREGARRADLLVNVTNDGWFGDSDGTREHHLLHARWRAVELGVPVVRAANTGISCVIDARGRVLGRAVARQECPLTQEIDLPEGGGTIYGRVGNVLGPVSALVTAGLAIGSVIAGRRAKKKMEREGGGA